MKKVTVTHLEDGQWFGLTSEGDFILLEHVPEGTGSGDIIEYDEGLASNPTPNIVPFKKKENGWSTYRKISTIAAAVLLFFATSLISIFSPSAEASSITFYGEKEWTVTILEDGTLFDEVNQVSFKMDDEGYWTNQLHNIGTDEERVWIGVSNDENNPHVDQFLLKASQTLSDAKISIYSFSFNQEWWEIKTKENLSMKDLVYKYLEKEYSPDKLDNAKFWENEINRRYKLETK
jgi:hypothetical protein